MAWTNGTGYGHAHRKRRAYILAREPICRTCKRALATELDHIVPKFEGGTDDMDNLQPLCRECHQTKTARESARAKGFKYRERLPIGIDGWPVKR